MNLFLSLYGIAAVLFVVVDSIWLGLIANKLYKEKIGHLLAEKVSFPPAVLFYLIFLVGLVVFVIKPGMSEGLTVTAWKGALFGLVAYATYDLTNQATLKDWPHLITAVDMLWGTLLGLSVSIGTVFIYTKLFS